MVADFKNALVDVARRITEAARPFFRNFFGLSGPEGQEDVDHTKARHPFRLSSKTLPNLEEETNKTVVRYYFESKHSFLDYSKLDENLRLDNGCLYIPLSCD